MPGEPSLGARRDQWAYLLTLQDKGHQERCTLGVRPTRAFSQVNERGEQSVGGSTKGQPVGGRPRVGHGRDCGSPLAAFF